MTVGHCMLCNICEVKSQFNVQRIHYQQENMAKKIHEFNVDLKINVLSYFLPRPPIHNSILKYNTINAITQIFVYYDMNQYQVSLCYTDTGHTRKQGFHAVYGNTRWNNCTKRNGTTGTRKFTLIPTKGSLVQSLTLYLDASKAATRESHSDSKCGGPHQRKSSL